MWFLLSLTDLHAFQSRALENKTCAVCTSAESSVRRRAGGEFRIGKIEVPMARAFFGERFDLSKTFATDVTGPIYGPQLYFLMMCRGLRGLKRDDTGRRQILGIRGNSDDFPDSLNLSNDVRLWN